MVLLRSPSKMCMIVERYERDWLWCVAAMHPGGQETGTALYRRIDRVLYFRYDLPTCPSEHGSAYSPRLLWTRRI